MVKHNLSILSDNFVISKIIQKKSDKSITSFMESLILAQSERWRRA